MRSILTELLVCNSFVQDGDGEERRMKLSARCPKAGPDAAETDIQHFVTRFDCPPGLCRCASLLMCLLSQVCASSFHSEPRVPTPAVEDHSGVGVVCNHVYLPEKPDDKAVLRQTLMSLTNRAMRLHSACGPKFALRSLLPCGCPVWSQPARRSATYSQACK